MQPLHLEMMIMSRRERLSKNLVALKSCVRSFPTNWYETFLVYRVPIERNSGLLLPVDCEEADFKCADRDDQRAIPGHRKGGGPAKVGSVPDRFISAAR